MSERETVGWRVRSDDESPPWWFAFSPTREDTWWSQYERPAPMSREKALKLLALVRTAYPPRSVSLVRVTRRKSAAPPPVAVPSEAAIDAMTREETEAEIERLKAEIEHAFGVIERLKAKLNVIGGVGR